MADIIESLSSVEEARLAELEAVVDRGLQTFLDVGNALTEIREAKLYRATHKTFKAYCEERYGFTDSRARQLIAAAKTVTAVTAIGIEAPKSEAEARRLARTLRELDELEQYPEVRGMLPDLNGEAWEAFRASVAKMGVLHPIVLYRGWVLDGWQRVRACKETGVQPTFEEYDGDEPFAVWYGLNIVRAHVPGDVANVLRASDAGVVPGLARSGPRRP